MRVRVYYNLRKKCLSVQDAKTRRVIRHVDGIFLRDVEFKVSEAGRQRVLREGRKNVHAFVVGTICRPFAPRTSRRVSYNPYVRQNFYLVDTGEPIVKTTWAAVNGKNISIP